jgi:hypothetical protein|tara:strand:- start:2347 stop:3021 length:675 start_codon:yes stop_codon:yes gene_type:complete
MILIFLLFVYLYIKLSKKDKFIQNDKKKVYNYCHIAKTAGTSLRDSVANREEINYYGHSKLDKCSIMDNNFVIIRDPIDRFISSFNYCKYGSDIYRIHDNPSSSIDDKELNINEFISKLKEGDEDSWNIINSTEGICGEGHWKSQHDFIGEKTKLACYNKDPNLLEQNINNILKGLPYLELKNENKTGKGNHSITRDDLNDESIKWIEEHFSKDLSLWKQTCDN